MTTYFGTHSAITKIDSFELEIFRTSNEIPCFTIKHYLALNLDTTDGEVKDILDNCHIPINQIELDGEFTEVLTLPSLVDFLTQLCIDYEDMNAIALMAALTKFALAQIALDTVTVANTTRHDRAEFIDYAVTEYRMKYVG